MLMPSLDGGADDACSWSSSTRAARPLEQGFADAGGSSVAVDALGRRVRWGRLQRVRSILAAVHSRARTRRGRLRRETDPSGACLWGRSLGITDRNNVAVDVSGNVWVTGLFDNSVDLDDCAVAGTDAQGRLRLERARSERRCLWSKSLGTAIGESIAVDASENVFITGASTALSTWAAASSPAPGAKASCSRASLPTGATAGPRDSATQRTDELGTAIAVDPSWSSWGVRYARHRGQARSCDQGSAGAFVAQFRRTSRLSATEPG